MTIRVYNTLTKQKEEFVPVHPGKANIYVCGVTPYNHPHIGNARPFVTWDVIRRFLEHEGYDVLHVQNFTDVDDKIINTANKEGVLWSDVCGRYIDAYFEVMDKLNVRRAHVYPRVSEHMEEIIETVKALIDRGYAYEMDGDVYYSVEKFEHYGELSGRNLEDMMAGARVDVNDKKHNPMDFALWKAAKPGEPSWSSPWGEGRPGWHIECSTMSMKYLGETFDFHGGGSDLIFPHHENEIAQSRAAYETPIANYWIHNGMVNIDGEKMSKSLGNVIWAKDMIEKIGGNVLRWVFLSAHYRSPLNINEEAIETAKKELQKVQTSLKQAYVKLALADVEITDEAEDTLLTPFMDAMQDDMNTPNAFAALFETVKVLNQTIRQREVDLTFLQRIVKTVETMLDVLGIENNRLILSDEDKELHHKWKAAVKEKDFATADDYRARLIEKGIL